ncbi:MAG: hypothetical protein IKU19_00770 [Clostridia bacterium]|nr:hypothetical protein [Clostridia bacterium]
MSGRLYGTYNHSIDKKRRLFLPAKIRANIGNLIIAVKSFSGQCVALYPEDVWIEIEARIHEKLKLSTEDIHRNLYPELVEIEPDDQGRIPLTEELCRFAGLEKEIVTIGVGKHAEIWNNEEYEKLKSNVNTEDIRAQLRELGL